MDDLQEARLKAIEESLEKRMYGREKTDEKSDHGFGQDEEREKIAKNVQLKRYQEMQAQKEAQEAYEAEMDDLEWQAEQERMEREATEQAESEENLLSDPEEVFERFKDEFEDVWENEEIRQPLMDSLDLSILEEGRNPLDYRTYEEIGTKFRNQMKALEENPGLITNFRREDDENRLRVKRLRQIHRDNLYYNTILEKEGKMSHQDIQLNLAKHHQDVVSNSQSLGEVAEHAEQRIQEGSPGTGFQYGIYKEGADLARARNVLREMAEQRGQDPDDI